MAGNRLDEKPGDPMRARLPAFGMMGILVSASAFAHVTSTIPVADQLRQLEARWLAAAQAGDADALAQILAPEFFDIRWNGQIRSRDDVLAAARSRSRSPANQVLKDMWVERYGDCAVVTGMNVSARGAVRFTDLFVRRGGKWLAVRAQETPIQNDSEMSAPAH